MERLLCMMMIWTVTPYAFANHTLEAIRGLIKQRTFNGYISKNRQDRLHNNWHYNLVFFYSSTCPHCQRFAPIVRTYGDQHHIPVTAYTTGNNMLPAFPRSQRPTSVLMMTYFPSQSQRVVPALFLTDHNQHIFPVSIGEMSYQALSIRMQQLLQHVVQFNRTHAGGVYVR